MFTTSRLAVVGALAAAYFLAVVALLHVLDPATDPVRRTTSQYANGPYGVLMTSCFLALGVSSATIAIAFARTLGRRFPAGLLLIPAVAGVLSAIFPTDRVGAGPSTAGTIHQLVGLVAFITVASAELSLSWAIRRDARFARSAGLLMGLSLAAGASFIVGLAVMAASLGLFGAAQRVVLAFMVSWLFLAALRLREIADQGTARSASSTSA